MMPKSDKAQTAEPQKKQLFSDEEKAILKYIPPRQSPKIYVDLIKSQILGTDRQGNPRPQEELLYFLYVCKRTGLDPMAKQIYAVYRWNSHQGKDVMTIQVSIDGMRTVAQRSGQYAGQDEVVFDPKDEKAEHPEKACVTIYKVIGGQKVGISATARWKEYAPYENGKLAFMWAKMPYLMLGKCAESLALRKGFPNDLSGIYSAEEMAQSNESPLEGLPTPKSKVKKEEAKNV